MPLLLLIFIVVPLIELFVIIEVGQAIGLWPTIALLFFSAILGSLLLRAQGRAVWRRFNNTLAERRIPHREVFDGVLVIVGGALLLTPGFVTDVVGLLLLIPPSRDAIRGIASKLMLGRVALGGRAAYWGYGHMRDRRSARGRAAPGPQPANGAGPSPGTRPYDFEGQAQEIRDETLLDPPRRDPER
jgi:UPF0716 protein FxsA